MRPYVAATALLAAAACAMPAYAAEPAPDALGYQDASTVAEHDARVRGEMHRIERKLEQIDQLLRDMQTDVHEHRKHEGH